MKNLFVFLLLFVAAGSFAQDKQKVKIKKDVVTVDKVAWSSFSKAGGKFFMGILNGGDDFMSYTWESFMTGRYDGNGNEIKNTYIVIEFYDKEIESELAGEFEIDMGAKEMIRLFVKHEIIKDNKFNQEGAKEFRKKYSQDISGRRFLTK